MAVTTPNLRKTTAKDAGMRKDSFCYPDFIADHLMLALTEMLNVIIPYFDKGKNNSNA